MYATVQNLIDRYRATELAQLADDPDTALVTGAMLKTHVAGGDMSGYTAEEQAATAAAAAMIEQRLADASDLIDGFLQGRYSLPLTSVPRVLVHYACDLAHYLLHRGTAPQHVEDRHGAVLKALERISTGKIDLGLATDNKAAAPEGDAAQVRAPGQIFTSSALENF